MEDMQRDVKDLKCQLHIAECPTEKDLCMEAIDLEGSVLKEPMQPSLSSDLLADVLQPLISQPTIPDAVQPSLLSSVILADALQHQSPQYAPRPIPAVNPKFCEVESEEISKSGLKSHGEVLLK